MARRPGTPIAKRFGIGRPFDDRADDFVAKDKGGSFGSGNSPSRMCRSVRQTAQALTAISS